MLTRAAQRRHALRYVEHAAEKLQLPWLCPALSSPTSLSIQRRTTTTTTPTRPSLPKTPRATSRNPPARRLASAASITDDFDHHDEYLPFAYERHSAPPSRHYDESVPTFDLSNIIMIDQTTALPPQRSVSNRSFDMRADAQDIEATLEACLQVQRWDRAFHILSQLSRIFVGSTTKLQQVYNRVLEAMVFDFIWNRNTQNQDRINKWIEVHMRKAGVEPNAQTFALKIKVALSTLDGSRRNRTVTRYWEMAKAYQFENQVASLRNILSDNDLGKLTEICPLKIDFELEPEVQSEEQDTLLQNDLPASVDTTTVRETDQKGLGLVSLRQALALFKDFEQQDIDMEKRETLTKLRQSKLEQDSLQSAIDRWKIENEKRMKMGVAGGMQHGKIGALTWQWHEQLSEKIIQELKLVEEAEASSKQSQVDRLRCEYGPFLRLLQPQQLAALTTISLVQTMSKLGVGSSVKLARLVLDTGKSVEQEVMAQRKKAKRSVKKAKLSEQNAIVNTSEDPLLHSPAIALGSHWSNATVARIGAVLCEQLFDVAKMSISRQDSVSGKIVTIAEPVFQRNQVYVHGRKVAAVSLLPEFSDILIKQPPADLIAKQLPMICPPKAWTGFAEGGYLETTMPVLRVKFDDVAQRDYAKAAAERGDLDQVFAGLDVLGRTGWRINSDVFNVMLEAWNSGEAIAKLPPIEKVFPDIEKPDTDASSMEKWAYLRKIRAMENEKSGLHSNRCFQNFQMEIARAYLNHTFYLPHNLDFRGRAYPIPPYLNQMGADNARGLLLFDKGRELGVNGLKWIQVHLANVYGYDKASLSDRAQFALEHIGEIRDSVNNPLGGKRWWLSAEDPWQCLATCHEFVRALDSPDPTKYISHLPVHQDGTCNGLQHYAALGGDIAGARQVNLEPGDKPADVYTGVAELVKAEIKQDAAQGLEIAQLLEGRITRKVVKQTVMTNVYGVTFTGAIRQVRKQVNDILPDLQENGMAGQAATYIARKIFKGLGTLFEGAHEIQYWLGDCANRITHSISPAQLERLERKEYGSTKVPEKKDGTTVKKNGITIRKTKKTAQMIDAEDFRSTIVWTTPLKLPVVQPYRVSHAETIHTSTQNLTLTQPSAADAVHPRKQLQGFPPNFVHSLDASHMMLSALKANEMGLSFSAVHDSFWTHAADIETLNTLLRDAFIQMHDEDIIGRLAAEFRARYKGHWYLAKIGSNNDLSKEIKKYRNSLHANGKRKPAEQRHKELMLEVKRQRLLASEDDAERAEGEAMVTAASLFEKFKGERYLPSKVSLGHDAIGEIPEANPLAVEEALQAESGNDVDLEHVLDPFLDAEDNGLSDSEPKKRKAAQQTWVWLPLTFKSVPKKGDFKVSTIRNSTYFFS